MTISPPKESQTPETITTPEPFTGAQEEQFTLEEELRINQERDLRNSSPYDGISFVVSYNYEEYLFDVSLGTPRNTALEQFNSWKELSFPSIPDDQFRLVN